jgi:hypothetical protein
MHKRVLEQADLMDRVMDAIGINPARAARIDRGIARYEARSRCIGCADDQKCRSWLAHTSGAKANTPPEFCPNAAFFRLAGQINSDRELEESHEPVPAELEAPLAVRLAHAYGQNRT